MSNNSKEVLRTGLTWYEKRQLRGEVSFHQDFKCWGCNNPLIPYNGYSILHHKNGNPKDNRIINLAVVCQVCHYDVHSWQDSIQRGLRPKTKKISKKELIRKQIVPLGVD